MKPMQVCAGLGGIGGNLGARMRDLCAHSVSRHACARCFSQHTAQTLAAQLCPEVIDLHFADGLVLVHHDEVDGRDEVGHGDEVHQPDHESAVERRARILQHREQPRPVARRDGRGPTSLSLSLSLR